MIEWVKDMMSYCEATETPVLPHDVKMDIQQLHHQTSSLVIK